MRWGRALAFGLGAAFAGGLVWGAITAVTGYMFTLIAVVIGLLVAWALYRGGGRATVGLIVAGVLFTMLAVFLGQVVAFSIFLAPYGVTPLDVIAAYPQIVSVAAGDVVFSYLFGLFGVAMSAQYLWRQMRAETLRRRMPPPFRPFPQAVPEPGGSPAPPRASLRMVEARPTRMILEVSVPPPDPHVVRAELSQLAGGAKVLLDGQEFAKTRVFTEKSIDVPLGDDPPRLVTIRFSTVGFTPQIQPFYNHMPLRKI